jgi:hypothetical protein
MMMTMMMLVLMLMLLLLLLKVLTLTESTRRSIQFVCSCLNFPVHALYRFPLQMPIPSLDDADLANVSEKTVRSGTSGTTSRSG